jgi:hypothetical protein
MHAHVSVSLLETVVFLNKVQVVSSDDNGTLHLHFSHDTSQDTSTNCHHTGEWAFLVDVVAADCLKFEI